LLYVTAPFSVAAHLDLEFPDQAMTLKSGQLVEISWDVYLDHGPGVIDISYSTNDGVDFTPIVSGIPHIGSATKYGSFLWTVPPIDSSEGRIRANYIVNGGGEFWNGKYPGENDPAIIFQTVASTNLTLEEGVDTYAGTRDATLYSEAENSNGGGGNLFTGRTNNGDDRRALLAFDLSDIPAGSTILSAELTLTVSKQLASDITTTQTLYRMTSDWNEGTTDATGNEGFGAAAANGDATWTSSALGTSAWTSAGGDFSPTASAAGLVNNSTVGNTVAFTSMNLVTDLQGWLDGDFANAGWAIVGDETFNKSAIRYFASESSSASTGQRPSLVITYEPPPMASVNNWIRVY